jgi:RNA polymerase sigma-70 factor (ECF subfamily)
MDKRSFARIESEYTPIRTPEKIFERRWALTVLKRALGHLEAEYADSADPERAVLFRRLRPKLFDESGGIGYEELAASLKLTPGAVRVTAHRLRQRCRELFREELAQTVENPAEIEEELRYLRRFIAS